MRRDRLKKLIKLLVLASLTGCVTVKEKVTPKPVTPPVVTPKAPVEQPEKEEPEVEGGKYKVGDCLMIVDLPRGETTSPYRVRIEKIEGRTYWYRWLLEDGEWALDLSCLKNGHGPCAEFESLEKISKKVDDCPNG